MARSVELRNKNKKVGLNEFTQNIILNIVLGIVKSLRGVDPDEEIVITLGKAE